MSQIGVRLKSLRDSTGHTQEQMGNILGKSRESIKKYERDERQPDLETITKISQHFNISADYILGITDAMYGPGKKINEYIEIEKYLQDKNFFEYLKLAIKMFINKLNPHKMDQLIEKEIKELAES